MKGKRDKFNGYYLAIALMSAFLFASSAGAQTSVFTYQGKLNDGGIPANGGYDMRFRLFDSANNQIGTTQIISNVTAINGIFSVNLDFGATAFSGAERFLEIAISPAGQNNFTVLAPIQRLTSTPYSIQAANSTNLGGIAPNQFVLTNDPRLDVNNYVQNTTTPQTSVNFNIGGVGSANILNAVSQFNLGGARVLSIQGAENLFVGIGAGTANMTGQRNAFFGRSAGNASIIGNDNAFFGFNAGLKSNSFANSFFGSGAGTENINGNSLAFFGTNAGNKNVNGVNNSFYGNAAGRENISGNFNTFLGFAAGLNNTTGSNNIFIGNLTGNVNTATQVDNSIAIGNGISVSTSDTIIIGKTSQTTQIPGKLAMGGGVAIPGFVAQSFSNLGFSGIFTNNLLLDNNALNNVLPSSVNLCIRTTSIGGGFGGEMLTRCTTPFSSVTNKTDIQSFTGGLEIVKRLKPVSFKWKTDGSNDLGLNAEDVAEIAPLLIKRNVKGDVLDVSESGLSVILINAIKDQQKQIEQLNRQIEALKKLICASNPTAETCKGGTF